MQGTNILLVSINSSIDIFWISFSSKISGAFIILSLIYFSSNESKSIIFWLSLKLGWNFGSKYINCSLINSTLRDFNWQLEVPNKKNSNSSPSSSLASPI